MSTRVSVQYGCLTITVTVHLLYRISCTSNKRALYYFTANIADCSKYRGSSKGKTIE